MERYVVSAQRSGLNWLRFCLESFYGRRTPGQTSLIPAAEQPEAAFVRSHDALNLTSRSRKKSGGAWTRLDPAAMQGAKVLLLVRDPLETFVRMAERRYPRYLSYISNIRFWCEATGAERHLAHYEDLVADPAAMAAAMAFLDIPPAPGFAAPTVDEVRARWDALGRASRANYDAKQTGTGGAQTRDRPTDFAFHQRALDADERAAVWRFLQLRMRPEELRLLERYVPEAGLPAPRLVDRLRFALV